VKKPAIILQLGRAMRLAGIRPAALALPAVLGVAETVLRLMVFGFLIALAGVALSGSDGAVRGKIGFLFRGVGDGAVLPYVAGGLLAVTVLRAVCAYAGAILVSAGTERIAERLSVAMLGRHLEFGQRYYDGRKLGAVVARAGRTPARVAKVFGALTDVMVSVGTVLLCLAALAALWWQLAVLTALFLAAFEAVFRRVSRRVRELGDQADEAEDAASSSAQELLSNLGLVRLLRTRDREVEAWRSAADSTRKTRLTESRFTELIAPVRDVLTVLVLALIVGSAAMLGAASVETASKSAVFFLILRRCVGAYSGVLKFPDSWLRVMSAVERYEDTMRDPDESIVIGGAAPALPLRSGIEFRNVRFRYSRKVEALCGFTARIPCGGRTVIVGRTGSGKSTVFRLLLRSYNCEPGTILLDGADLAGLRVDSHLARLAYANETPTFFDDTVRRNVTYGLEGVSEERLIAAARNAQALDFIERLDRGFDEPVGEGGRRLSAGERQRLGLMRVFLADPELILLDEATSAMDPATESRVLAALDEFARGRTVAAITHRMNWLKPGAWVIVMDSGRAVDEGFYEDVTARGSLSELVRGDRTSGQAGQGGHAAAGMA